MNRIGINKNIRIHHKSIGKIISNVSNRWVRVRASTRKGSTRVTTLSRKAFETQQSFDYEIQSLNAINER